MELYTIFASSRFCLCRSQGTVSATLLKTEILYFIDIKHVIHEVFNNWVYI